MSARTNNRKESVFLFISILTLIIGIDLLMWKNKDVIYEHLKREPIIVDMERFDNLNVMPDVDVLVLGNCRVEQGIDFTLMNNELNGIRVGYFYFAAETLASSCMHYFDYLKKHKPPKLVVLYDVPFNKNTVLIMNITVRYFFTFDDFLYSFFDTTLNQKMLFLSSKWPFLIRIKEIVEKIFRERYRIYMGFDNKKTKENMLDKDIGLNMEMKYIEKVIDRCAIDGTKLLFVEHNVVRYRRWNRNPFLKKSVIYNSALSLKVEFVRTIAEQHIGELFVFDKKAREKSIFTKALCDDIKGILNAV